MTETRSFTLKAAAAAAIWAAAEIMLFMIYAPQQNMVSSLCKLA